MHVTDVTAAAARGRGRRAGRRSRRRRRRRRGSTSGTRSSSAACRPASTAAPPTRRSPRALSARRSELLINANSALFGGGASRLGQVQVHGGARGETDAIYWHSAAGCSLSSPTSRRRTAPPLRCASRSGRGRQRRRRVPVRPRPRTRTRRLRDGRIRATAARRPRRATGGARPAGRRAGVARSGRGVGQRRGRRARAAAAPPRARRGRARRSSTTARSSTSALQRLARRAVEGADNVPFAMVTGLRPPASRSATSAELAEDSSRRGAALSAAGAAADERQRPRCFSRRHGARSAWRDLGRGDSRPAGPAGGEPRVATRDPSPIRRVTPQLSTRRGNGLNLLSWRWRSRRCAECTGRSSMFTTCEPRSIAAAESGSCSRAYCSTEMRSRQSPSSMTAPSRSSSHHTSAMPMCSKDRRKPIPTVACARSELAVASRSPRLRRLARPPWRRTRNAMLAPSPVVFTLQPGLSAESSPNHHGPRAPSPAGTRARPATPRACTARRTRPRTARAPSTAAARAAARHGRGGRSQRTAGSRPRRALHTPESTSATSACGRHAGCAGAKSACAPELPDLLAKRQG